MTDGRTRKLRLRRQHAQGFDLCRPLLASSLAITYDVGFFVEIGIGFFSFFSLSEHLVFALQSLPFAIPPVAVLLFWFSSGWLAYRHGYNDGVASIEGSAPKLSRLGSLLKSPWLRRLLFGIMCLAGIAEVWLGQYALAFMLGVLILYIQTSPDLHKAAWKSRSPVLMATCAGTALILSFLVGLQRAHAILKSESASEMIGVDDKPLPARLIRGGDKGILFFSLDSKKVRFLRWDAIKQIETL